jgi:hypothetical protein
MKTRVALLFALSAVCLISECTAAFGQKLYPVSGPLAAQTPAPVFSGQISRPMFSRSIHFWLLKSWTIANGEVLRGKCSVVTASSPDIKVPGAPDSYPPQPNLAFAWDAIKGQGFYVSHVLGNKIYQGTFTGDQGTVLQVESVDNETGVAIDNKGNVYKIVW